MSTVAVRRARPAPARTRLTVARRKKARGLLKRTGARRAMPGYLIVTIVVLAIVAGVLLEQVMLAQSAFRLSDINKSLASAEARQEELLAELAELESPGRIERYARTQLGMTDPAVVEYIVANVRLGTDNRIAHALRASRMVDTTVGGTAIEATTP